MSDIYDYAYAHVLNRPEEVNHYETIVEEANIIFPRPEEVNSYGTTVEDSNSKSEVNTTNFSVRDLQMFIDCLEAFARLYRPNDSTDAESNIVYPRPQAVYSYGTNVEDSNAESEVNTADFSPRDLQLFVDSLEVIARLHRSGGTTDAEPNIIFPHPGAVHSYEAIVEDSNSEGEVNTANFSPLDLQMFVDSLEVIARLEQAKLKASKKIQVTCLDSSTCEDDANSSSNLSRSSAEEYLYDETYFGVPNCRRSTALYTNLMPNTVPEPSDSEESGVFVNNTYEGHLYENMEPLRPRSKIIFNTKPKSLKSRIISLFLKKQYMKLQKTTVGIMSSTSNDEQSEAGAMYDTILDDVIKQQLESKKCKKNKKKPSGKKSKENIFSKAIRKLTL